MSKKFDSFKLEEIIAKPTDYEIKNILNDIAKKQGFTLNANVADIIINNCIKNIELCVMELKKIMAFKVGSKIIAEDDCNAIASQNIEGAIFALIDALGKKNSVVAFQHINELLKDYKSANSIFPMLATTFNRMFLIKTTNLSNDEIVKELAVKEYAVKKLKEQASNFGAGKLKDILQNIVFAENCYKNGEMSQENAIFYVCLNILN